MKLTPFVVGPAVMMTMLVKTPVASCEGEAVRDAIVAAIEQYQSSLTNGDNLGLALEDLSVLSAETSSENWDGYGAAPLEPEVFQVAEEFITSIPESLPRPELSASPLGDISIEWAQSATQIVSVGISKDGMIHFASLNGAKKSAGQFPFNGSFDTDLYKLICDVLG